MKKSTSKSSYSCQSCGAIFPKWSGQCSACFAWNTLVEQPSETTNTMVNHYAGDCSAIELLSQIDCSPTNRIIIGIDELDRVLGGGLVCGSVILMGGSPGIGKSTLLLQTLSKLSDSYKVLYVSGEESLQQIVLRANRLGLSPANLQLLAETHVERIIDLASQQKLQMMVIDSVQTSFTSKLSSAPGSVAQVRESTALLVNFAKRTDTAIFLVGHVTKEGAIAGPRVLEHMVDTVLYFEGRQDDRHRLLRAVKNRFGSAGELGIFVMTEKGLRVVSNPSAIFLSRHLKTAYGSIVTVIWEGSRPLLVEIQALVDETKLSNPNRVTVGIDYNRLLMLLAVLHRHGGVITYNQDIFINVVGGIKVIETATDLPLLLTIISGLQTKSLSSSLIVFGEVGLSGEIRPVINGQQRLQEAVKHGFTKAIVPRANLPKSLIKGLELVAVDHLSEALMSLD